MDCSKRQAIAPVLGQLVGSEPPGIEAGIEFEFTKTCAHTLLLSKELCHVALPKGSGFGAASLGEASGLRKWVMIWKSCPKNF
jgi:hypothetical protein